MKPAWRGAYSSVLLPNPNKVVLHSLGYLPTYLKMDSTVAKSKYRDENVPTNVSKCN
jgi:hypothetical protein